MVVHEGNLQFIAFIQLFFLSSFLFSPPVRAQIQADMNPSETQPSVNSQEQVPRESNDSSETTSRNTKKGTISIGLRVPNTSWSIRIQSIYRMDDEIWVFSELSSGGIGASVITTAEDTVTADLPELPVTHYVWGKEWNWENNEDVTFIGYFDYYRLKLNAWWSGQKIVFHRNH